MITVALFSSKTSKNEHHSKCFHRSEAVKSEIREFCKTYGWKGNIVIIYNEYGKVINEQEIK